MSSLRSTWRMVSAIAMMSLVVVGTTFVALRAAAQTTTPAPAPAPAPAPEPAPAQTPAPADANDDGYGPGEKPREVLPPDMRESADNNITFPVDI